MPALPPITPTVCPASSGSCRPQTGAVALVIRPPIGGVGAQSPGRCHDADLRVRGGLARAPHRLTQAQQRLRRSIGPVGALAAGPLSLAAGDAQPRRRQCRSTVFARRLAAEDGPVMVTARAHRYLRRSLVTSWPRSGWVPPCGPRTAAAVRSPSATKCAIRRRTRRRAPTRNARSTRELCPARRGGSAAPWAALAAVVLRRIPDRDR